MKNDGKGIVMSSGSLSISENAKRRMHLRFESYDLKSDIQMLEFKNYEIWRKHLSMSLFDYFNFWSNLVLELDLFVVGSFE